MTHRTNNRLALLILPVALVVAATMWLMARPHSTPTDTPHDAASRSGRLIVSHIAPNMIVKSGSQVAGSYRPAATPVLYYTLSDSGHKVFAGGSITVASDGHFSRNVSWNSKDHHGAGYLRIYTSDQTESVETVVQFE